MKTTLLLLATMLAACATDLDSSGYVATGDATTGIRFSFDGKRVAASACPGDTEPFHGDQVELVLRVMEYLVPFDVGVAGVNAPATWTVAVHGGGSEQCVQAGLGGLSPIGWREGVSDIWLQQGTDPAIAAAIVAHELGHLIGALRDSTDRGAVMYHEVQDVPVTGYMDRMADTTAGYQQDEYQQMLRVLGPAKAAQ